MSPLTVLDGVNPESVRRAIDDLEKTSFNTASQQ